MIAWNSAPFQSSPSESMTVIRCPACKKTFTSEIIDNCLNYNIKCSSKIIPPCCLVVPVGGMISMSSAQVFERNCAVS